MSKQEQATKDFEAAHAQGLHDEIPRQYCPLCERPNCSICGGPHGSLDCPANNAPETI